jgi:hypothetical protein
LNSHITKEFRGCFRELPEQIKRSSARAYRVWCDNPNHPGLRFKRVGGKLPVYSVRIGIGWRALGVKKNNDIIWFWIGSHADYEELLKNC